MHFYTRAWFNSNKINRRKISIRRRRKRRLKKISKRIEDRRENEYVFVFLDSSQIIAQAASICVTTHTIFDYNFIGLTRGSHLTFSDQDPDALKTVPEILQERYENKLKGVTDANGEVEDREVQPPPAKKQKLDHTKKPIKKQEKQVAEPEESDDVEGDQSGEEDVNGEADDAMDVQEIDEDSDSDSDNSKNRIRNVESEKHSELKKKLLEKINELRKQRSVPELGGNFNVFFWIAFWIILKIQQNFVRALRAPNHFIHALDSNSKWIWSLTIFFINS